jgi:hypothetical protein
VTAAGASTAAGSAGDTELVEFDVYTAPGLRVEVSAPEFADEAGRIAAAAFEAGILWGWEQGARQENEAARAVFKRTAEALESGALHEGTPAGCLAAGHEIIAKAIREATAAEPAKAPIPTRSVKTVVRDAKGQIAQLIEVVEAVPAAEDEED